MMTNRVARPAFLRPLSVGVMWVCLGVVGVSAVAATAIWIPTPHGRSIFAPEARLSTALPMPAPDFHLTQTWREEHAELAGFGLSAPRDDVWMPHGGLSTLLARRFPSAGHVRFDIAAPLPQPRPDTAAPQETAQKDTAQQDTPRAGVVRTTPVVADPQLASLPPQPKSESGLFDKLFADPDRAAKAVLAANPNTVLYDIVKRVVYMPDGEKLEAHSGFGEFMDDPNSMHRKDVGVTPPNVYTVSFREKPFHGVRALRMKPVGNGNMYGRDGFLTHSFLLGTNGQSNGCISLRDYDKFLKAYEDGKFNQIIVLRSADEPVPAQVASN